MQDTLVEVASVIFIHLYLCGALLMYSFRPHSNGFYEILGFTGVFDGIFEHGQYCAGQQLHGQSRSQKLNL